MSKAEQLVKQYTKDQVWEGFDALPESVKDIIMAPKTLDVLSSIGRANGLPEEKIHKLGRYTDLILSGIVPITLFRETLEEELSLDTETARKIATDVRDRVFAQVRDELIEIHKLE